MRKVWLVIKREYVTRVRTKAFVITTILIPGLLIGFIALDVALSNAKISQTLHIAIVDETGTLAPSVSQSLERNKLSSGEPAYDVAQTFEKPAPGAGTRPRLIAQVRDGSMDGFLWIPADALSGADPEFVTRSATLFTEMDAIKNAVRDALIARRFQRLGIGAEDVDRMVHSVNIQVIRLTKSGETHEEGQALIVAIAMTVILYATLLAYGQRTMRSVMEEKTSRVMEILLSSIQPFQLLAGKILGIAAVGLTQFLIWAVSGGLLAAYGLSMARLFRPGAAHFTLHIPAYLLVFLVVYFIGGYFLYSSIYAAIGAMVSTEQDAQQLQMPVTVVLIAGFLLFEVVLPNPNAPAAIVLSIIPFFSPMLMLMRIGLQTPPVWQIALSLAVLAATVVVTVYITARLYRVGVLMYGKRPSLLELVRWFRYS
jgi:ABC-2 type transport system permease protein